MSDNPNISTTVEEGTNILDAEGTVLHSIQGIEPVTMSQLIKQFPDIKEQGKLVVEQYRTTKVILNRMTIEKQ